MIIYIISIGELLDIINPIPNVYTVQCIVYTLGVHCTLYTVHCTGSREQD